MGKIQGAINQLVGLKIASDYLKKNKNINASTTPSTSDEEMRSLKTRINQGINRINYQQKARVSAQLVIDTKRAMRDKVMEKLGRHGVML